MMEFFVPAASSPEQAQAVWDGTKKFAEENLGRAVGHRRIYRLSYVHDGKSYDAKVGENDNVEREQVICILDAGDMYLVCTPNRGVLRGEPILVGKHDTHSVEDFDPAP